MNIFEQAARNKLRFQTEMGILSAEDLWQLPLSTSRGTSLDDIARGLNHALKDDNVSFVNEEQKPNATLQLSFDIVKHIIDVKKAERTAAQEAKAKADKKQKLLALIEQKENEALSQKSLDELRAEIASM